MKIALIVAVLTALLIVGIYYVAAPGQGGLELGQGVPAAAAAPTPIRDIVSNPASFKGREVTIRGKLVEICPTTGCWGYVEDGTGRLRWDSGASGWAMPRKRQGQTVTLHGSVTVKEDGSVELATTGARF